MPLNLSSECCVSQGPMARHQTPTSWPRPSNHFHLRLWWHTPMGVSYSRPKHTRSCSPLPRHPLFPAWGLPTNLPWLCPFFRHWNRLLPLSHLFIFGEGSCAHSRHSWHAGQPPGECGLVWFPEWPFVPSWGGSGLCGAPQWTFGPPGMNQQVPHWLVRDFLVLDSGSF